MMKCIFLILAFTFSKRFQVFAIFFLLQPGAWCFTPSSCFRLPVENVSGHFYHPQISETFHNCFDYGLKPIIFHQVPPLRKRSYGKSWRLICESLIRASRVWGVYLLTCKNEDPSWYSAVARVSWCLFSRFCWYFADILVYSVGPKEQRRLLILNSDLTFTANVRKSAVPCKIDFLIE